jgi:hypothetical protein
MWKQQRRKNDANWLYLYHVNTLAANSNHPRSSLQLFSSEKIVYVAYNK